MPTYRVTDKVSGRTLEFTGPQEPSSDVIEQYFVPIRTKQRIAEKNIQKPDYGTISKGSDYPALEQLKTSLMGFSESPGPLPTAWEATNRPAPIPEAVYQATSRLHLLSKGLEGIQAPPLTIQATEGASQALTDLVKSFTSPLGIAATGASTALPEALQRIISGAFGKQMLEGVVQHGEQAGKAYEEGNVQELVKQALGVPLTGTMGALSTAHAVLPKGLFTPSTDVPTFDAGPKLSKTLEKVPQGQAPTAYTFEDTLARAQRISKLPNPQVKENFSNFIKAKFQGDEQAQLLAALNPPLDTSKVKLPKETSKSQPKLQELINQGKLNLAQAKSLAPMVGEDPNLLTESPTTVTPTTQTTAPIQQTKVSSPTPVAPSATEVSVPPVKVEGIQPIQSGQTKTPSLPAEESKASADEGNKVSALPSVPSAAPPMTLGEALGKSLDEWVAKNAKPVEQPAAPPPPVVPPQPPVEPPAQPVVKAEEPKAPAPVVPPPLDTVSLVKKALTKVSKEELNNRAKILLQEWPEEVKNSGGKERTPEAVALEAAARLTAADRWETREYKDKVGGLDKPASLPTKEPVHVKPGELYPNENGVGAKTFSFEGPPGGEGEKLARAEADKFMDSIEQPLEIVHIAKGKLALRGPKEVKGISPKAPMKDVKAPALKEGEVEFPKAFLDSIGITKEKPTHREVATAMETQLQQQQPSMDKGGFLVLHREYLNVMKQMGLPAKPLETFMPKAVEPKAPVAKPTPATSKKSVFPFTSPEGVKYTRAEGSSATYSLEEAKQNIEDRFPDKGVIPIQVPGTENYVLGRPLKSKGSNVQTLLDKIKEQAAKTEPPKDVRAVEPPAAPSSISTGKSEAPPSEEAPKLPQAGSGGKSVKLNPDLKNAVQKGKLTQKEAEGIQKARDTGEGGAVTLFGPEDVKAAAERFKKIFFRGAEKLQSLQLKGMFLNKTDGYEKEYWQKAFQDLPNKPLTPDEFAEFVDSKKPRVEVRKLEVSTNLPDAEAKEYANLQHWYESQPLNPNQIREKGTSEDITRMNRLEDLANKKGVGTGNESATARFTMVNPKPLDQMPGAVDLLVRIPLDEKTLQERKTFQDNVNQAFPFLPPEEQLKKTGFKYISSHYPIEGKNLVAHVRGYMETTPDGKKVFHVFEVQSDWAQSFRDAQQDAQMPGAPKEMHTQGDPLLKHYERFALKAAIDHAISEFERMGIPKEKRFISVSDYQSVALTEGWDRIQKQAQDFVLSVNMEAGQKRVGRDTQVKFRKRKLEQFEASFEQYGAKAHWEGSDAEGYGDLKIDVMPFEGGGTLHYDNTLPKIAKELTGSEGERVSFGEHQNTFETRGDQFANEPGDGTIEFTESQRSTSTPRKDLILRNPDGSLKTDITARMYPLDKVDPSQFTLFGSDKAPKETTSFMQRLQSEEGSVINPFHKMKGEVTKDLLDKIERGEATYPSQEEINSSLKAKASELGRAIVDAYKQGRGRTTPRFARAGSDVEEAANAYSGAQGAVPIISRYVADSTLHPAANGTEVGAFSRLDQLLDIYNEHIQNGDLEKAKAVNFDAVFKDPTSPIKNWEDFHNTWMKPEVQESLLNFELGFGEERDQMYKTNKQLDPDAETSARGFLSGVRMSLPWLNVDETGNTIPWKRGGTSLAPALGTAKRYDLTWQGGIERGYAWNYAKAKFNETVTAMKKAGIAKSGTSYDPDFKIDGHSTRAYDMGTETIITKKEGEPDTTTKSKNILYIRSDYYPDFHKLIEKPNPDSMKVLKTFFDLSTRAKLVGISEAAGHGVNMLSTAYTQFGTSAGHELTENLGPLGVISSKVAEFSKTTPDSLEGKRIMNELARIGAARPKAAVEGATAPMSNFIHYFDSMVRINAYQGYKYRVSIGKAVDSPAGLRDYVNRLGNYNPKTQADLVRALRSSGVNRFATASTQFAINKPLDMIAGFNPRMEAPDAKAALQNRMLQASRLAGVIATTGLITASLNNGDPLPKDTKVGEISWTDDKGKRRKVDGFVLFGGYRRAFTSTGADSVIEGTRAGYTPKEIAHDVSMDIGNALLAPVMGPPVRDIANFIHAGNKDFPTAGIKSLPKGLQAPPGREIEEAIANLNPIGRGVQAAIRKQNIGEAITSQLPFGTSPRDAKAPQPKARSYAETADTVTRFVDIAKYQHRDINWVREQLKEEVAKEDMPTAMRLLRKHQRSLTSK